MSGVSGHVGPVRSDGNQRRRPWFLPSLESSAATGALNGDPTVHGGVSGAPFRIPYQWQRRIWSMVAG
jgi:hypothetical protein